MNSRGQRPGQMNQTLLQRAVSARIDEVGDCFGFGQVDAPVKVCTAAEFAWIGDSSTFGRRQRDDFADQINASVAMKLGDILPGKGSRPGHQHAHRAVEHVAILGITNLAQLELPAYDSGRITPRMPKLLCDLNGSRSGEAHDRNGAASMRCCWCYDSVLKVHRLSVCAADRGGFKGERLPEPIPYGDMKASRAAPFRSIRPESGNQSQVRASARVSGLELAATDETNLSTPQPSTQTDTRLSRPDGDSGRAQRTQTPPRQRPQTVGDRNTTQATRLTRLPGPRPRFAFRAADRLHRRADFLCVQRNGVRFQSSHFVVYAARFPESEMVRLGTTVSKRLGNAVTRNRIKRRIRECFRLGLRFRLPAGTCIVVIGRAGAGGLEMGSVRAELDGAIAKLRLRLRAGHE